jgi:hypothetical protein
VLTEHEFFASSDLEWTGETTRRTLERRPVWRTVGLAILISFVGAVSAALVGRRLADTSRLSPVWRHTRRARSAERARAQRVIPTRNDPAPGEPLALAVHTRGRGASQPHARQRTHSPAESFRTHASVKTGKPARPAPVRDTGPVAPTVWSAREPAARPSAPERTVAGAEPRPRTRARKVEFGFER